MFSGVFIGQPDEQHHQQHTVAAVLYVSDGQSVRDRRIRLSMQKVNHLRSLLVFCRCVKGFRFRTQTPPGAS